MFRPQYGPRSTIIPPVAASTGDGVRYPSKLVNGVRNTSVTMRLTATVVVSVATATTLLNRGSVCALFNEIVLDENGVDKMIVRGNVLRAVNESLAPSQLSAVRAAAAVGTYQLEEMVQLFMSSPLSRDPMETAFIEHDARATLNVSVKLKNNLVGALFVAGPATVVVSNVKAEIVQNYDKPSTNGLIAPLFIPLIRQTFDVVPGANAAQDIFLRTPNLIRAVVVSQEDSVLGEVSDALNGIQLRGDYNFVYGPGEMSARHRALAMELEFGGKMQDSATQFNPHEVFNFQRFGKLSECLNPTQDSNLRLSLDVQPSPTGVAAGGSTGIRVTSFELVRDPVVCAPKIPFPY